MPEPLDDYVDTRAVIRRARENSGKETVTAVPFDDVLAEFGYTREELDAMAEDVDA